MSYLRSQPSPQSLVLSPHETDDSPAGRYQSPRTSGGAPFRISSLGPGAHAESVLYSCPLGESGVTWHGVMVHFCVLFCSLFIFSFLFFVILRDCFFGVVIVFCQLGARVRVGNAAPFVLVGVFYFHLFLL